MEYVIWFILFIVAVSDAKEHRIPNALLLLTLIACVARMIVEPDLTPSWSAAATGFAVMFAGSLMLHLLRVMAPGDVKLLAVIGFWLGWGQLFDATLWIAATSIMVGLTYALVRVAGKEHKMREQLSRYKLLFAYGRAGTKALEENSTEKLRMPFAPIVVIGVALHHYF
ncbi:A24 family peptidase [Vibrio sp. 16]|uniref:A24 family peptidase n=1 Tax=Vibrio sp. 16 TaxID=391586 RepID=UPI00018F2C12|nr:A24 family peptidase [Vibrio sp. 16]EED27370.1 peptidase, A24 (type IV prepilin peptidase) family [Vibrio sp. 16]CAK4066644.1 hypothetical protein VDT1_0064 [Vibrio sp. 16]